MPGLRLAIGWGVSQTGRFLRHFVYQGFNEDERGRIVFDGVFDQVGGAGRGIVQPPLRPAVARPAAALQHPVPGGHVPVHRRARDRSGDRPRRRPARAGPAHRTPCRSWSTCSPTPSTSTAPARWSTPTSPARATSPPPETSRIYMVASAPHIVGAFPPGPFGDKDFVGQAAMNPLVYAPVLRARVPRARRLGGRRHAAAAQPLPAHRRRDAGRGRRGRLAGDSGRARSAGADDRPIASTSVPTGTRGSSPRSRPGSGRRS